MLKKVKETIINNQLIKKGDKIIVALSGGPDSVCLAHILSQLSPELKIKIILAHLNHNLRGKESEQDAQWVKKFSGKLNLPLCTEKLKTKPKKEEEARCLRYEFLEKIRTQNKAQKIAVAHTADDQVETILFHFLRGAGLSGISGMFYQNKKIIRPLLDCRREEILNYLKKNNLSYRLDRTNRDTRILRNKIRHKLIPFLILEYNPQIKKNILNLGEIANQAQNYLEKQAQKFLQNNPSSFSLKAWRKLPPALKKETLRQALKKTQGDLVDIYAVHLNEVTRMLETPLGNKKKVLPRGLLILKKDGKVIFAQKSKKEKIRR